MEKNDVILRKEEVVESIRAFLNMDLNSSSDDYKLANILRLIKEEKLSVFFNEKRLSLGENFPTYYAEGCMEQVAKLEYASQILGSAVLARMVMDEIKNENYETKKFESFSLSNIRKLMDAGLYGVFKKFADEFRGRIRYIHEIYDATWVIIETMKKDKKSFYVVTEGGDLDVNCFETFESALLYSMNKKHHGALLTLVNDK